MDGKRKGEDKEGVASGFPTVEDVAGAGAMFKANAKRTKGRIVSSTPFGVYVHLKREGVVNTKANTQSAPQSPKQLRNIHTHWSFAIDIGIE